VKDRYALFGHPVKHSRSPGIHADFSRITRYKYTLELIDCLPEELASTVQAFGREGGRGANITLPHKEAAAGLAHALSERAKLAGAVNTLRFETDGILFGDNTDGAGLVRDLTHNLGLDLGGKRILILGAGGAARGIVGPLLECHPEEVVVANRTTERAMLLAARFGSLGRTHGVALEDAGDEFDLVINATSASLSGCVPEVDGRVFGLGSIAYDLCYGLNGQTAFTQWAKTQGAGAAVDGWGMLVEQAAESFHVWFGHRPDTSAMYSVRQL